MKKKIIISLLAIPVVMLMAFKGGEPEKTQTATPKDETEVNDCLVKYRSAFGEGNCMKCTTGTNDTYVVCLKNTCDQKLDVVIAVQEKGGFWSRFQYLGIEKNDTLRGYACNGTGKYLKFARVAGNKEIALPTQQELNEQYK